MQGQDGGLRGIRRAQSHTLAPQVGQRPDAAVGWGNHHGGIARIHVAHGQRPTTTVGTSMDLHPRQVRVPGNVHLAGEQCLHQAVVIGKQHVIDGWACLAEVFAHPLPDGDDARVVSDGADHNGCVHQGTSEQGHVKQSPGYEIVQDVGRRGHDRGGACVAEVALHAQASAKRGAATRAHRQVGDL
jgi:hypothetical protein